MDQISTPTEDRVSGQKSRAERFVGYVIERIHQDSGFAARLKRADNPATEYQSWELLAGFGVDLEKEWERLPHCIVGAALARSKPERDGSMPLGSAIAACFDDGPNKGSESDQAKARLRRLLACTTTTEACRILRPLLALMASRGVTPDFSQLLQQLLWFTGKSQDRTRARWAQEFYRRRDDEDDFTKEAAND